MQALTIVQALALGLVAAFGTACVEGDEALDGGEAVLERPGDAAPPAGALQGHAPSASGGIPAMVTLTPIQSDPVADHPPGPDRPAAPDHPAAPARGDDAVVDQFGLAFSPRVLVAADGESISFTNSEGAITHNIHIRSVAGDSTVFNGDTGPSGRLEVRLPAPGGYDVLCDMHPGMTAFVFVTEAPYAMAAEPDGTFLLDPVPPGTYQIGVWTVDGGWGEERAVTVSSDLAPLDLRTP